MNDLRIAVRTLRKSPGFASAAVITVALAIAAATSVFSVASAVLLEPLGYRDPGRIVRLSALDAKIAGFDVISYPDYLDVVQQSGVFSGASAFQEWNPAISGAGTPEALHGGTVDSGFFDVLGVRPALGRFFVPEEDRPGGDTAVVISHELWQRKFGASPDVLGKTVLLDARPMTVAGVTPRGFEDPLLLDRPRRTDVWTTNAIDPAQGFAPRGARSYAAIARLRDGITLQQAEARVAAVAGRLAKTYPESRGGMTILPLQSRITSGVRGPLWTLLAAVLLLLLLACVNIANLFLARVDRKGRDAAIRTSLGATTWHLVRQVFAETVVVSAAGSVAGLLLAHFCVRWIVAAGAASIPRLDGAGLDLRVLLFVAGVAFLTALFVGLVPALQLRRGEVSLRPSARGTTTAAPAAWLQSSLVVAQVAISIVLLVGAALVARSLRNLLTVDTGLNPGGAATFSVRAPRTGFPGAEGNVRFFEAVVSRLERIPGVDAAGATTILPLGGDFTSMRYRLEGQAPEERTAAELRGITPGYFAAVGQTVVAGRDLTPRDGANAPKVMVVDELLARRHWSGRSPLGARVTTQGETFEIVGVVRAARILSLAGAPEPAMYVPHAQAQSFRTMEVVLRGATILASLEPSVRAAVGAVSKDAPVGDIRPLREVVAGSAASERFRTMLLSAFGVAALLLATLGLAGTLGYVTSCREREIGVRMALGATAVQIASLVVSRGLALVLTGTAIGVVTALASTRLLRSMLFGVTPADPLSFAAVVAVLLASGVAASAVPALRAARTDPMSVMRAE